MDNLQNYLNLVSKPDWIQRALLKSLDEITAKEHAALDALEKQYGNIFDALIELNKNPVLTEEEIKYRERVWVLITRRHHQMEARKEAAYAKLTSAEAESLAIS